MDRIRDYKIISLLGEGGMGKVYLAEDETLGRKVAIKMLDHKLGSNPDFIDRFKQEARAQANLHHPNIITLHSYFEENGIHCIVMEYVNGKTLKQIIKERGKLPQKEALKIFFQILEGVGEAHQMGIVHRDLKPSNIIVDINGRVKIMDFGIAKILGDRGLTKTGLKMGTMYYMSPEQVRAQKDIDQRADIYALGITMFEMLTGIIPFSKNTESDFLIMQEIVSGKIDFELLSKNGVNGIAAVAIRKMTETDKANRPPTCLQVERMIQNDSDSLPGSAKFLNSQPEIKIKENPSLAPTSLKEPDPEKIFSHKHMVQVEGGSFTRREKKLIGYREQLVTLDSFYISKYQVTQEEWEFAMGSNPSHFKGFKNLPVENVSWYDAVEFCNKLSEKEGLEKVYSGSGSNITMNMNANGYRLPTEAEWEYAARGGSQSKGYEYSGSNNENDVGWYKANSGDKTHPVGQKQANELGIYDMSGNVWEWCWDWYDSYSSSSQTNPTGAPSGSTRVHRGGSWNLNAGYLRTANRYNHTPDYRFYNLGFRAVRNK